MSQESSIPHLHHEHGSFRLVVPKHVLLCEEYRHKEVLLTYFRAILPSVEFSKQQFDALKYFAQKDEGAIPDEESNAHAVANRIARRSTFDDEFGCWLLPLTAEYDTAQRARYPHLAVPGITSNASAHKLTFEYLLGEEIETYYTYTGKEARIRKISVDHLCHRHACCNPYHLEAVHPGENTRRGRTVRVAKQHHGSLIIDAHENLTLTIDELMEFIGLDESAIVSVAKRSLDSKVLRNSNDKNGTSELPFEDPSLF